MSGAIKRLGAVILPCALALGIASVAWAADVLPTQSAVSKSSSGEAVVDMLAFEGEAGETVFINASSNGTPLASRLPHTLGEETSASGGDSVADMFALRAASDAELAVMLESGIDVEVFSDPACTQSLYKGHVWPVYADLGSDSTARLIGAHTGSGGFTAPDTLLFDGQAYRLSDTAEKSGDAALTFTYEAYDPSGSIDGAIRYIDVKTGKALTEYTVISALEYGAEPREVAVPQIIEDSGTIYRTIAMFATVQAANPASTTFTVPVIALSEEEQSTAGYYVATINMVDADGAIIATDQVYVRGEVAYTLPDAIYKAASGDADALTYTIAEGQEQVLNFSAKDDGVTTGTRTVEAHYVADTDSESVAVTFVLQDGTKRAGDSSRLLGTLATEVTPSKPKAVPPATLTDASGATYVLVGAPDENAYELGSRASAIKDAYYLPEGYSGTMSPYSVKVTYVDFATRQTIDSETFTSSPDDIDDMLFAPPAQFEKDGATWVRLDGQEQIAHSFYSQIAEYTVYYRDRAKPLESIPVITQVRVVYRDGGITYVDGGTVYAGGAADGTARLDAGQAYNVAQGQNTNQNVTGQDGRDALQQRIDEQQNPLSSDGGIPAGGWLAMGGLAAAGIAAIAAGIIAFLRRRRKDDGDDGGNGDFGLR